MQIKSKIQNPEKKMHASIRKKVIYLLNREGEINRLQGSTLNVSHSTDHNSAVFLNHNLNLSQFAANLKHFNPIYANFIYLKKKLKIILPCLSLCENWSPLVKFIEINQSETGIIR